MEIQDLDITKNPIKVTKLFLESFVNDMKTQFDSFKNAFIDLKTSVNNDVKDMVININKATEIATAAKSIADLNTTAIIELRTHLKAELKEELDGEILELKSEINEMKSELCSVKIKYRNLERDFDDVKNQTNNIETYYRKDNIVFYGIAQKQNESNDECAAAVRKFMVEVLKIPQDRVNAVVFIRCHRIRMRARACPIIAWFREYNDRELVWSRLKQIPKNKGFFFSEDFPKSVTFRRKKLLPVFYQARKVLGKKDTSLKGDVLTISGEKYTTRNLDTLRGDLHPKTLSRKQNNDTLVFGGSLSEYEPFSNWGKFPVKYNGITFPTLEHAYMHEKCLVNDDVIAARAVLEAQEPHQAKQIGGRVKVTDKWSNAKCKSVMKDLLKNKFSEGSELARELLATGDKHLAESGRDQFYACGMSFVNKDVLNKQSHTGKNMLGQFLMEIRRTLS